MTLCNDSDYTDSVLAYKLAKVFPKEVFLSCFQDFLINEPRFQFCKVNSMLLTFKDFTHVEQKHIPFLRLRQRKWVNTCCIRSNFHNCYSIYLIGLLRRVNKVLNKKNVCCIRQVTSQGYLKIDKLSL